MHGNVSDKEWEIWRDAYTFYAAHCNPPPNQNPIHEEWWKERAIEVGVLYNKWDSHKLMAGLLVAVYEYLGEIAKEKTEEMADFVQE